MYMTICISIILLFFACCSYPKQHSSSYFKYSFLKDPLGGSLGVQGFRAGSELACALRCDRDNRCNEAIFDMASKKCSLHHKRDKCSRDPDVDEENEKSRSWKMTKVINLTNKKLISSCSSAVNGGNGNTNSVEGQNYTTGTSCHDIRQRNRQVK
ncbi:uncharacterized protein [Pocillopora verrucosa]|uniref:uncharacterized protein n=1 Tax=Pocillopora verrucosa TaxID=203993 RepID=UPI00333E9CFC